MADHAYRANWAARYDEEIDARVARNNAVALLLDADFVVHPAERIGPPPPRRRSPFARAGFVILATTAGGWGLSESQVLWRPWVADRIADGLSRFEQRGAGATVASSPPMPAQPTFAEAVPDEPMPTRDIGQVAGADAGEPVPTETKPEAGPMADGVSSAPASPTEPTSATPLSAPKVDPADPYQKRAFDAGLHPELSRALLSRLSEKDYRNAHLAVAKAMTEASDDETFFWPQRSLPDQAQFRVHFVAGAAPDCRRYIVTVSKDGWSTTAQPMEKCGVKKPKRGAT
jgi:hypothetical protein